jgi:hypothetical protein
LASLTEQEMIEAACVWKAIDAQLPAWFRGDLDARAILQIRLVTLAQPRPETTPWLAYDELR